MSASYAINMGSSGVQIAKSVCNKNGKASSRIVKQDGHYLRPTLAILDLNQKEYGTSGKVAEELDNKIGGDMKKIYDLINLVGRNFKDPNVKDEVIRKKFEYLVKSLDLGVNLKLDEDYNPKIELEFDGENVKVSITDVFRLILENVSEYIIEDLKTEYEPSKEEVHVNFCLMYPPTFYGSQINTYTMFHDVFKNKVDNAKTSFIVISERVEYLSESMAAVLYLNYDQLSSDENFIVVQSGGDSCGFCLVHKHAIDDKKYEFSTTYNYVTSKSSKDTSEKDKVNKGVNVNIAEEIREMLDRLIKEKKLDTKKSCLVVPGEVGYSTKVDEGSKNPTQKLKFKELKDFCLCACKGAAMYICSLGSKNIVDGDTESEQYKFVVKHTVTNNIFLVKSSEDKTLPLISGCPEINSVIEEKKETFIDHKQTNLLIYAYETFEDIDIEDIRFTEIKRYHMLSEFKEFESEKCVFKFKRTAYNYVDLNLQTHIQKSDILVIPDKGIYIDGKYQKLNGRDKPLIICADTVFDKFYLKVFSRTGRPMDEPVKENTIPITPNVSYKIYLNDDGKVIHEIV